jgi:hypothetical protein
MALQNLLKKQVDTPVYEWMRFSPVTSSSTSCTCKSSDNRYIYYMNAQAFYRYDTYSDSWQELNRQPFAAQSIASSMVYCPNQGFSGSILGATSTTVTIPSFSGEGEILDGVQIKIVSGTGAGQVRTISGSCIVNVHDYGIATSTNTSTMTDNRKKWTFNQWAGYSCRFTTNNTSQGLISKIIYHSDTVLTFYDANWHIRNPYNTYIDGIIGVNTGSQNHYTIESARLTISSPWGVLPDRTSRFMIESGGIFFITGGSSTAFSGFYFYDVLNDLWTQRTNVCTHYNANIASSDIAIEAIKYVDTGISNKQATSATSYSITKSTESMEKDRWDNYLIEITSGTGIGQSRRIVSNNSTTFYVEKKWDITPDNTSVYRVIPNINKIWLAPSAVSSIASYNIEEDVWNTADIVDYGIARNISLVRNCQAGFLNKEQAYAVSSIARSTGGIVSGTISNPGSNYLIGDIITCSTGGTVGFFKVDDINTSGGVTSINLHHPGSGYSNGITSTTGGTGSGLTINITTGVVGYVSLALTGNDIRPPLNNTVQDSVTISGCATDTSFNGSFDVIGSILLNSLAISCPLTTTNPTVANSQSTTMLVDASKNWTVNEHVGKRIYIQSAGFNSTIQSRRITSNTATTISFAGAITAPINGTSRYYISEMTSYGAMQTSKIANQYSNGWVSSSTATSITDNTKQWYTNQWRNCRIRIESGVGAGNEVTVLSNTNDTINVASWTTQPDSTSTYSILESTGIATTSGTTTLTNTSANFETNILSGKRLKIVAGTGLGAEATINSNTATVITLATSITTDTTSVYCIYENQTKVQGGSNLLWLYGTSNSSISGKYLFQLRDEYIDIYDITTGKWNIAVSSSPRINGTVGFSAGTMFTYDGNDKIIINQGVTSRLYEYDIKKGKFNSFGVTPYNQSNAIFGNRIEIIETEDGLKYLYIMRHTGQELWRTLLFW